MPTTTPVLTARAFSYVRVSSDAQTKTDYSDDGLSIDAQRAGVQAKALQLSAKVVGEFSDPGRSAYADLHKRTGFLEMLEELKRRNEKKSTRVDYVIVWDLSRYARNVGDHFQCRAIIQKAGARLISITEPIAGEDSPAAFLYEGVVATFNQFQSMQTAEKVRGGLKQKASVGGTYGPAKLGYLNSVDELPDGRRVATVVTDPDRAHFITTAFKLYDSGEYSISQLTTELDRLGLRSRQTPKRPAKKLGTSVVQRLLRNPYYAGLIVYRRDTPDELTFPGRHEPLIDPETFERVQLLLDEKRVSGERPQKHRHYLKGSVFCDDCGQRLTYGITTGSNGTKYPYYFCSSRINGTGCPQRANIRPELIEDAIADYWADVQLPPGQIRRAKEAVRALAAESHGALNAVRVAKTELISRLTNRQDALVDMRFSEKSISAAVFKRQQAQLEQEIAAAQQSLAETDLRLRIDQRQLEIALELVEDVRSVYLAADDATRRRLNQAFFKKLLVGAEWDRDQRKPRVRIQTAALTEPYALLLVEDLVEQVEAEIQAIRATDLRTQNRPEEHPEDSAESTGVFNSDHVSIFQYMAEREGFEPSMGL
jgi:site-specific DNA recombinase